MRRVIAVVGSLLLVAGLMVMAPRANNAEAAVNRNFSPIFSAQSNGEITVTGNTLMTCPPTDPACTAALAGNSVAGNNNFVMRPLDADNDPSTSSSSGASVKIPEGGRVLFAGLFWGGTRAGTPSTAPESATRNVKFRAPGGGYQSITANRTDNLSGGYSPYSSWADVTSIVRGAGAGEYWAADAAMGGGVDRFAGWGLVVVYAHPSLPLRDLTVSSGAATLGGNETVNIPITGFRTPQTGPVNAKFGQITFEGDQQLGGDSFSLNGTSLADAQSPSTNFFNSRVSTEGSLRTDRAPAHSNNMALDAKAVNAPGIIPNGATSATARFSTVGDVYYPVMLSSQIDLYAPNLNGTKSVTNLTGSQSEASVGDVLEYTVDLTNVGEDPAVDTVVTDAIPAGTSYVPDSLRVTRGAGAGDKTDAVADDQMELSGEEVVARMGDGASATRGGRLDPGASTTFSFRVRVEDAAAGGKVVNSAAAKFASGTLPDKTFTYETNEVQTPVAKRADVSILKEGPERLAPGESATWTLRVSNAGPSPATDVRVIDPLPEGLSNIDIDRSECDIVDGAVDCSFPELAVRASETITITARTGAGLPDGNLVNHARVTSGTFDPNPDNDTSQSLTELNRSADVALRKTAEPSAPAPGELVTWTLTATNDGPSRSEQVQIFDTLPSGVTIEGEPTTSAGTCTVADTEVRCVVDALDPGESVQVTVVGKLDSRLAGGEILTNRASTISNTPDPDTTNDSDSVDVVVGDPVADIQTTKSGPDSAVPGEIITFDIEATNVGPSQAVGVTVEDVLPDTLEPISINSVAGDCSIEGQAVRCSAGTTTIAVGQKITATVRARVLPGATGSLVNTAVVSAQTADPNPDNNTGETSVRLVPQADLSITKVHDRLTEPVDGDTVTYTLQVDNLGPSDATDVVVVDTLPAGLVPGAAPEGCTWAGQELTCQLGTVAVDDEPIAISFPVTVNTNDVTTKVNTATVTSSATDPDPSDNEASAEFITGTAADLSVTKEGPDTITAGEQGVWTLTVSNNGPSDARDVTVVDELPSELQNATGTVTDGAGTCAAVGAELQCTGLGTLRPGESRTIELSADIDPGTDSLRLINSVRAESTTPDPFGSNNRAFDSTAVHHAADLETIKSGPSTVTAGEEITWEVLVTNHGPSTAREVSVADLLPPGIDEATAVLQGCDSVDGLSCLIDEMAVGEQRTFTVSGMVSPSVEPGTQLVNTADASSAVQDPDPSNDLDEHPTTVESRADVSVDKSVDPSPLVAGSPGVYKLTVSNAGPSTARDVVVTDELPPGLIPQSVQGSGECEIDGQTVTCRHATVAPGGGGEQVIFINVSPDIQGESVSNTVNVTTATPDPDPSNDQDTVVVPIEHHASLRLSKIAADSTLAAGDGTTFFLSVVNEGPSRATDVVVTDRIPEGFDLFDAPGCDVDAAARTVTCRVGDLGVGEQAERSVWARVDSTQEPGVLVNDATATSPTAEEGARASAEVAVETRADVELTKAPVHGAVLVGHEIAWNVALRNNGPSAAQNLVVTDEIPEGVENPQVSMNRPDADCRIEGRTAICRLPRLLVGGAVMSLTGTVSAEYRSSSITNSAHVEVPADPEPGNNAGESTIHVVQMADMAVTKDVDQDPAVPGERLSWTVTGTNKGDSIAPAVRLYDLLPPGLRDITIEGSDGARCHLLADATDGAAPNSGEARCFYDDVRVDDSVTMRITAVLEAGVTADSLTNHASVASEIPDPKPGNNHVDVTTALRPSADVRIEKELVEAPPVPGEPATWRLRVTNDGPSVARDVVVRDEMPAGVSGVEATAEEPDVACEVADGAVTCRRATVAPGETIIVTMTGVVDPSTRGEITNTATVSTSTGDPDSSNDTATTKDQLVPSADLALDKRVLTENPQAGAPLTWRLTMTNHGPSAAEPAVIGDTLPEELTDVRVVDDGGLECSVDGRSVLCSADSLAPGASASIEIVGTVDADATGEIVNTGRISSGTPDPVTDNDTATTTTPLGSSADVSLTKRQRTETPVAGQQVEWDLVVRNDGPAVARDVRVTDALPEQVTNARATGAECELAGRTLTCADFDLAVGEERTITVTADIVPTASGELLNSAEVRSGTYDPTSGNNSDTSTGTVVSDVDLSLTKDVLSGGTTPGAPVTWTVQAVNHGPSTASNVTVTDELPPGITDVEVSADPATACRVEGLTVTCERRSLDSGATMPVQITGVVSPEARGELTSEAAVTTTSPDRDPGNDSATVTTRLTPDVDLAVTKQVQAEDAPTAGDVITWQVVVANSGTSDATGVVLTDRLPSGVSDVEVRAPGGIECTTAGGEVTCPLGTVPAKSSVSVEISGTVPSNVEELTNAATVVGAEDEPTPEDNEHSVTTPVGQLADVAVSKELIGEAVPGEEVTWRVAVENRGPDDARDVLVRDVLPAGLLDVEAHAPRGASCSEHDAALHCRLGELASGAKTEITVTGRLGSEVSGEIVNAVHVTNSVADTTLDNNESVAIDSVTPSANLAVVKTRTGDGELVPGRDVGWTITVTNEGPSTARDVVIDDVLATEAVDPRVSVEDPLTGCVLAEGQALRCGRATLAPGDSFTVQIDATVAPTARGELENTATVSGSTPDPNSGDDVSTVGTSLTPSADLDVRKTLVTPAVPGEPVVWRVVVTNLGPSAASPVSVVDEVPHEISDITTSGPSCAVDDRAVTCLADVILPGDSVTVEIGGVLAQDASGELVNTARVTSPTPDPVEDNDQGTARDTILKVVPEPETPVSPEPTKPGDPGPSEPGPSEPGPSEPGPSEPGPSEPGPSEPGPSEPGPSEPGPSEPGPSEPGPSEPGPSEPGPSEPGPDQPAPAPEDQPGGFLPRTGGPAAGILLSGLMALAVGGAILRRRR